MGIEKSKVFLVELPLAQVLAAVERALEQVGAEIEEIDRAGGRISAKKGLTWTAAPMKMEIFLAAAEEGTTVDVSSRDAWGTAIVDFGANERNIDALIAAAEAAAGARKGGGS